MELYRIVENSSDCAVAPYSLRPSNINALTREFGNELVHTVISVIRVLQGKGGWLGFTEEEVQERMPIDDGNHRLRTLIEEQFIRERDGHYFVTQAFVVRCLRAGV